MSTKAITATLTALILTGLCSPQAAEAGAQPTKDIVPIKGAVTTVITVAEMTWPILNIEWDGSALISHLGRVACHSHDEIVDFTPVLTPPVMTGTIYFEAANGDVLIATMDGFDTTEPGELVSFSGVLTFLGGSGRFSGASGTARYSGGADMQKMVGWFAIEGAIQYKRKP